eukprot:COSAG01_NODE_414_length_17360_cov_226.576907_5_plen_182_part_00
MVRHAAGTPPGVARRAAWCGRRRGAGRAHARAGLSDPSALPSSLSLGPLCHSTCLRSTTVHRMAHTSRVIPPAQLILQISHISLERRRPAAFAAAARHTAALCEHQRSSTAAPRLAARATALLPSRSRAPSARTPDHLLPPPTRPRGPTRPQVPQHHAAHVSDVAANERREGRRHGLRRRR